MRNRATLRTFAAILGISASILTAGFGQATAASAAPTAAAKNCVVDVAKAGATSCYASFTAAIAKATNGRITNAPADSATAAKDSVLQTKLNAPASQDQQAVTSSVVISIEYEHIGYAGATFVFTAPHGCDVDTNYWEFSYDLWGNWDWNDEISSFRTYSGCWVNHFDKGNWQGINLGYQPSQYYIGDLMNDRTTSLLWS